MMTIFAQGTRIAFTSLAAVAVVSLGGVALDQGHIAAAPRGVVEVGELTPVNPTWRAAAALPEVTVHAARGSANPGYLGATTELPEIVVVARRLVSLVAQSPGTQDQASSPAIRGSATGALLK